MRRKCRQFCKFSSFGKCGSWRLARVGAVWRKIFVKRGGVIVLGAKKNAEVLSKKTVPRHFSKMGWHFKYKN